MPDHTAPAGASRRSATTAGRLRARIAALTGWRRHAAAIALGAVAALAMPPFCAAPLLLVAFPGLLFLLDGAERGRAAFAIGWSFGFGFFVAGLYWIAWALTVDLARFFWLIPFAVAGLPALLGVFTGLALWLLHGLRLQGISRVLAFAVLWTLAEYLRGHILTGFPWNLVGYSWVGWAPVLQSVAWIGIYGLSALTVAATAMPAAIGRRGGGVATALGLLLFAGLSVAGWLRLQDATTETVEGVRLRLVQPATSQADKWNPDLWPQIFQQHLALSARPATQPVTHIIWPETSVPYFLSRDAHAREAIARVVPDDGLVIAGAPRMVESGGPVQYFNSLAAIDQAGAVVGTYDKFHLVPFGEYVPFRSILPIEKITSGTTDFSAGPGPRTLELPGLPPVSPLICYEVIFPGEVTVEGEDAIRPAWLLNLTNDAWYGQTAGPHQHFAIARTRAVEEGLPLVRAATTGISGVVDAYGRVTARLGLGEQGVLDADLPVALAEPTLYARFGDRGLWLLLALFSVAAIGLRRLGRV